MTSVRADAIGHSASHVWTKAASGEVRCGYIGCPGRPPTDVERLEAEIATAARMRVTLDMRPRA
jgi:hypothetical protein